MIKAQELSDPNSCLNKAAADEPIFVLRAKDCLAPGLVKEWADRGFGVFSEAKRTEAIAFAEQMQQWHTKYWSEKNPPVGQQTNELQVYEVADCEWVVAESAEAARDYYLGLTHGVEEEAFPLDAVVPLSDRKLDRLTFTDHDAPAPRPISFRQEIERRKSAGQWRPGYFATGND